TEVPYDGIDQDCTSGDLVDVDGDGSPAPEDCDDRRADVHPDAEEIPLDEVDQDCDGRDTIGDAFPPPRTSRGMGRISPFSKTPAFASRTRRSPHAP
ncbi:MAG: putative metal-binding motif-containing protein, partial [Myxococcales bacterium]|nr:putative metal-binding motif-containing protein [Myxococcales bacterium]